MSWMNLFTKKQSGFVVGGVQLERPPATEDEASALIAAVATRLTQKLTNEQDIYWFVIEQYDKMLGYGEEVTSRVDFPFSMFSLEYEGRRSETSYVGKPNPGTVYLDKEFTPPIEKHFGTKQAEHWRAVIFTAFCTRFEEQIKKLRIKYATHYHNNCIKTNSYRSADAWNDVISELGGE
ncbi:hypothetical protein [Belnapia rosea]|uniref:Uncharacterized protein n=1 Tax=Belnapia rosea TaxID=938405 RepID=A0A1G6V725_9PROT|nr:hypothetical protein [Belnapia rosea]SDD49480.1 hypothetical protein SAMN04487779_1008160 [Belnapia rosea]